MIWIWGLLALLLGSFGTIVETISALDTIAQIGDMSPDIVAEGLRYAYQFSLLGLIVLISAIIKWVIVREVRLKAIRNQPKDEISQHFT
jgi:biopolymer transport protein ExbB/TolQ